ncbi:MAG TPA: hypothetical protein VMY37_25320 [Thermoguttaceae bacterium]|nr:hypothetical protein [Thermoguttaceae bacterium]
MFVHTRSLARSSGPNRRHHGRRRLRAESLEGRWMLSVSPILDDGALTVFGTPAADEVEAFVEDGDLSVQVNDATFVFPSGDVARINVFAGSGSDVITIRDSVPQRATLFGGSGNDTIRGSRQDDCGAASATTDCTAAQETISSKAAGGRTSSSANRATTSWLAGPATTPSTGGPAPIWSG